MQYSKDLIFVTGVARASEGNPIAVNYDRLLLLFIIEKATGQIVDAEVNMICGTTRDFVRSLLVGYNLYSDLALIEQNIKSRYWGLSRKALVVCAKDALSKVSDRLEQLGEKQLLTEQQKKGESMVYAQQNTICVVGFSRTVNKNPIVINNNLLLGSFLIDTKTGAVLEVQFNTICPKTSEFLSSLIEGLSFYTDLTVMLERVQAQYWEDSSRAIVAILHDAANKVANWRLEEEQKR